MSLPNELMPVGLLGTGVVGGDVGYQIERSLRFNSADSAYLSRTPASAGNRRTWTWAGWVKRSAPFSLANQSLFACNISNDNAGTFHIYFDSNNALYVTNWTSSFRVTDQIFRDFSAWYHLVVSVDTTNATANDRIKVYVNGVRVTSFASLINPTLNDDLAVNQAGIHYIGRVATIYLNGYLADIHFIDGQALDPSSFGETDLNDIWQPKAYSGTYGTNGFRLPFTDNSAATATTLGKDSAGSNNWTPNNLSVTAGAGNDSLVDSPTNGTASTGGDAGGVTVGNYATLNPLGNGSSAPPSSGLSNGNLQHSGSTTGGFPGTIAIPVGKWYWEVTLETITAPFVGVCNDSRILTDDPGITLTNEYGFYLNPLINYMDGSSNPWSTGSVSSNDIIGVAIDATDYANIKIWLSKNNTFYSSGGGTSGNPSAGTNAIQTITANKTLYPFCAIRGSPGSSTMQANFGQRPFAYAAPSGFKALCTTNLPTPTILKGSDYFDTKLYTGNGSTQTISGLGFSPDFVWIKQRSSSQGHALMDTIRGVSKRLFSELADAEDSVQTLDSFDSNGFSVSTAGGTSSRTNQSSQTYAAWAWDGGTSTVTNTAGSITSQVRANASAGFSIVTYTGTGATGGTVGHGLGVAPGMIIIKNRDRSIVWVCYHSGIGSGSFLQLNSTDAQVNDATYWGAGITSTTFGLQANNLSGINYLSEKHVAYCFAPVAGYSAFGSYTGNGSADGPFIFTSFRPRWVLIKDTSDSTNRQWIIVDSARVIYNENSSEAVLFPNDSSSESPANDNFGQFGSKNALDLLSNGFKVKEADTINVFTQTNRVNSIYIYAAFAENPFSISRAR